MTPEQYEAHAIATLKEKGCRITMPRVQVIRALADSERTLTAFEIYKKILAGGGKIDVVSVYRILVILNECGLIYHVGKVDGYLRKIYGSNVIEISRSIGTAREVAPTPGQADLILENCGIRVLWYQLVMEVA